MQDPERHNSLKTYRNKQGKGFLHLLRDLGGIPDFLSYLNVQEEGQKLLSDMLKATDGQGRTPLNGVFVNDYVFNSLKTIDPNLLVTPTGPDNITPLMAVVLNSEEISWNEDRKARYERYKSPLLDLGIDTTAEDHLAALSSEEIGRMVGQKLTLNDQIWNNISNNIYSKLRWQRLTRNEFDSHALFIAAGTDARAPIFQSFWQQNTDKRQEANALWQGYFAESDRLGKEDKGWGSYYDDPTNTLERDNPLRLRALSTVSCKGWLEPAVQATALKNMISTGGTFGINFKRTAKDLSFEEINAVGEAIRYYVGTVYAVKDKEFGGAIYTDLRESIRWVFDEEEKKKKIQEFLQSNFHYTVQSTQSADELLEKYVEPREKPIRSKVLEGVALGIRDDLMPSAEKLERLGLSLANKTRLANHQMTCAVLAAGHLPLYEEDLDSRINWFLNQSAISLGQKGLQITVDREGRLQRFNDLHREKYPDYEQRVDALRASQAAAKQEREQDDFHQ